MSNKQYQAALDQLEGQLRQMQTPTQFENDIYNEYGKNRNWLLSGDIKNPGAVGLHANLSPVANYAQQASYQVGAPNDASASGVTNPSQVYAQQLRNAANTSQLQGGAYEDLVPNVENVNQGLGQEGQSLYNNRTQNLISGANSLYGAYQSRPKSFWSSFLTGLAPSIGAAAESFI